MYRQYRDILSAGVFLRCGPEVGGSVAVMHINVIYGHPSGVNPGNMMSRTRERMRNRGLG